MKKILFVSLALCVLNGCATAVSDYDQGCRDGVEGLKIGSTSEFRQKYCDGLDALHSSKASREHGGKN